MVRFKKVITVLIIVLLPLTLSARSFLMQDGPSPNTRLGLRLLHPSFKNYVGFTFLSGVYDISLNLPMTYRLSFVGTLPILSFNDRVDSDSGIGNVYAGMRYRLKSFRGGRLNLELGVYAPTLSKDKVEIAGFGVLSDYIEFYKFLPEVWTVGGMVSYHRQSRSGFSFGVEVGPYAMIPREGDSEFLLRYGVSLGYRLGTAELKTEFVGVGLLTADEGIFLEDRNVNAVTIGIQWNRQFFRPSIFYTFYVNKDLSDLVRNVLGIKLELSFR